MSKVSLQGWRGEMSLPIKDTNPGRDLKTKIQMETRSASSGHRKRLGALNCSRPADVVGVDFLPRLNSRTYADRFLNPCFLLTRYAPPERRETSIITRSQGWTLPYQISHIFFILNVSHRPSQKAPCRSAAQPAAAQPASYPVTAHSPQPVTHPSYIHHAVVSQQLPPTPHPLTPKSSTGGSARAHARGSHLPCTPRAPAARIRPWPPCRRPGSHPAPARAWAAPAILAGWCAC